MSPFSAIASSWCWPSMRTSLRSATSTTAWWARPKARRFRLSISHFPQRPTLDHVGQQVVDPGELGVVDLGVRGHEAVLDRAVLEHEHRQQLPRAGLDEPKLRERATTTLPCDHGGGSAELREQLAAVTQRVVALRVDPGDPRAEVCAILGRDRLHFHQHVDEEPNRPVGGDPASRRVRLMKKAALVEVRQDVADRRGREVEPVVSRQSSTADGGPRLDVLGDDGQEDSLGPLRKLHCSASRE
jgi:hypothetical protein